MLNQLLRNLDEKKYKNVVISLREVGEIGERIQCLGIPVHAANMQAGKPTPSSVRRFIAILHSLEEPDLIHGWDYYGDHAAGFSKFVKRWNASVIWAIHHTPYSLSDERKLTAWLIRLGAGFSRTADQLIYVSQVSKSRHEALGYASKDARVIPNGFDPSEFVASSDMSTLVRSELGIDPAARLIGSIARYHPMKDHANFLNAAGRLIQKRRDVQFLLAGRQVDSGNPALMELVQKEGLEKHVHLLGERADVRRLMNALDVFTVSSAWGESFPLVIGEAMLCEVPCVVTDVGDSARVVGETGLSVPPRDPAALCAAWERLLGMEESERRKLGESARRHVIEHYSLPTILRQYEQLYADAISAA